MLHVKPEGGESPEEVAERQMRAMQHIMSHRAEQNVLVCMHGRAMRILLCQLTGISMSQMDRFEHSNLCLYVLKHQADMQFSIELANCTRHLTSEPSVCAHSVGAEV
jgi:probable phosphoglycerate mutase